MLPFSKRPPPPEEYFLRSGDFEAVQQNDPYAIPPAPRAPVFARQAQAAQTPYGFVPGRYQQYQQYGDLSVPPPPHSLAPVAMASERGAVSTSTNRSIAPVTVREKPSLKWGIMIAVTGALLGGVLGLGMDARRQSARAAAAQEAKDNAPAMVATALPQATAPIAANQMIAPAIAPPVVVAAAPAVIPPQPPIAVTAAKGEPASKPEKADKHVKATVAHAVRGGGGSLAVKVNKPPVEKTEAAPPPETKSAKVAADPEPKKAAPKKDAAGTSDAQKILEAANKDTANTL